MAGSILFDTRKGDVQFPGFVPAGVGAPATIDSTPIGTISPAQVTTNYFQLDTGAKTAIAVSGAATLNKMSGVITSEALTTAAGSFYTLNLTNSNVAAADQVFASVNLGAGTGGSPTITSVTPASGSVVIIVQNISASVAFNAAIKISFAVFKN